MPLCGLQMADDYLRLMGRTHMRYFFLQNDMSKTLELANYLITKLVIDWI